MRVALISIASGRTARIVGRSVAQRQLDFALALSCDRVICLGNGALPEAIALRHEAEHAGIKFQVARDSHNLLGATGTADAVFVFAEGLLPESDHAFELLSEGACILIIPASSGIDAGFERLDLDHAWAGAMRLPGRLVERLSELPADADPMPGLLRIARQARLPERQLDRSSLSEGSWRMLLTERDGEEFEQAWVTHKLPPVPRYSPTKQGMRWIAGAFVSRLTSVRPVYALVSALLLGIGGVVTAWVGHAGWAFVLLALAALMSELGAVLDHLRRAGFRRSRSRIDSTNLTRLSIDVAFVATGFFALTGTWFERLFPPLVLVGLLLVRPADLARNWGALIADRVLIAAVLGIAASVGLAEQATMLIALALLLTYFASRSPDRG